MTAAVPARVVIVGAGHAGGRAAINLRRNGYRGRITIVGDEPHPPYERPPLSKDVLIGVAHEHSTHLQPVEQWSAMEVELRLGMRVQSIERQARAIRLADGSDLAYDSLVLATGARARPFPGKRDPNAAVLQLRSLTDVVALRPALRNDARVGVIGAGFIGLEVASSALHLGARPVVIETASRPLARLLPTGFASWLADVAVHHGVTFRFDSRVQRLDVGAIVLDNGEAVPVDVTVVGIGATPNSDLAAAAGLATDDGVLVNGQCMTNDPSIYAIGDVARRVATDKQPTSRIESWRKAEDDALKVAAVIGGGTVGPDSAPWFWTDVFGHNIQLAGEPSDRYTAVMRGDPETGPFIVFYLEGNRLRGVIGVDCGRDVRAAQKLIDGAEETHASALPAPKAKKRPAVTVD